MKSDVFDNPLDEINERAVLGGNNPPSPIDDARAAYKSLSDFLARVPVIADEDGAKEAKLFVDRTDSTLKDLDAARDKEADPLYAAWKAAREKYKPAHDSLEKLFGELKKRIKAYLDAEKAKREKEAAEAAKIAAEKERLAREAEAAEQEAIANAKEGEFTDVGAATEKADEAFSDFERASRFAKRAEKDTKVKLGGGFGKAISVRTQKVLVLDAGAFEGSHSAAAFKAIEAMGVTDKIRDAILSSARDWRKTHGELPAGVTEIEEERI